MVLLLLTLLAQAPPDPGLQKALAAHQSGDMEAAIREYRAFLKTKPTSLEARSNLGVALSATGRFNEAAAEYKVALRLSPGNPSVLLNLALAYYKAGDWPTAARELSALRALVGDLPQVVLLLADTWLQMGEHGRIVRLLEPVAKEKPDDLAVAYLLGTAYARDKQIEKGQVYLDKILRQGESAEARFLMGTAKVAAADFAGALEEFKKAVALNPGLPMLQTYYGQALMATGDSAGAMQAFEAELAKNPNEFSANLNLAVLYKQDQRYAEARKFLDRALRLRPGDFGPRYQVATIDLAEGRVEPARIELEKLVAEAPSFTEAHVSLATVYYRLKRKADGDRHRAIVQKLNAEAQARQPKGEVAR